MKQRKYKIPELQSFGGNVKPIADLGQTTHIKPQEHPDDQFITPRETILEEAQAYGGLDKIKFKQVWIHCNMCSLEFPAQVAVGLDTTKLKCPVCGAQNSRELT